MDKDIRVAKEKAENNERVAVGSGNMVSQFWDALCEKHENEGVIVPHLHFISVRQHQFKVFLQFISLQFQNRKLFRGLSSSWLSYILLLQLHTIWIELDFYLVIYLMYLKHIFDETYSL